MLKLMEFIKQNTNWQELLSEAPYFVEAKFDGDFLLFKYSQKESDFNLVIVRECRGTIIHLPTLTPVCVPFFKFGNYGESYADVIDWERAEVTEKIDGSLIKVWNYAGEWHVSTNGTIDAAKANLGDADNGVRPYSNFRKLFDAAALNAKLDITGLNPNFTYMFELVSPYNRVVVPYDNVELYHIGTRDLRDMIELDIDIGVKKPMKLSCNNLDDLIKIVEQMRYTEEGYVVCDSQYRRVKVKSPAYVAVSHLIEGMNTRRLIGLLRTGEESEFVSYFPDYAVPVQELRIRLTALEDHMTGVLTQKVKPMLGATRKELAAVVTKELSPEFYFQYADERVYNVKEWLWGLSNDKIEYKLGQYEAKYGMAAPDSEVMRVAERILEENKVAFTALAVDD